MPFTFIRSSSFLNAPFLSRYSTIRWAIFGPMRAGLESAAEAVLMLTSAVLSETRWPARSARGTKRGQPGQRPALRWQVCGTWTGLLS
jgi:hypothetical protein